MNTQIYQLCNISALIFGIYLSFATVLLIFLRWNTKQYTKKRFRYFFMLLPFVAYIVIYARFFWCNEPLFWEVIVSIVVLALVGIHDLVEKSE